jgi:hypothetical protein
MRIWPLPGGTAFFLCRDNQGFRVIAAHKKGKEGMEGGREKGWRYVHGFCVFMIIF